MERILRWAAFGALLAGLLVDSQTIGFHWDGGFHLLAARSIAEGKRPYLDFCFPQAPLNAYWNAAWFRIFHPSWRLAQGLAAFETWLAVALLAGYLLSRFPVAAWRTAAAVTAASLFGLLLLTWDYGCIAQAYGFCLAALVGAFYCAVRARERVSAAPAFAAGLLAGAAASASLLTVTAAPVLLTWLWLYNTEGNRIRKLAAFVGGCLLPALPVLWALVRAPQQVWFNLVEYHTRYRSTGWDGVALHDLEVATAWLTGSQAVLLAALAIAGWAATWRSDWAAPRRAEFRLCLWLAAGTTLQNVMGHPTFTQYFIFALPFLAVLASAGLYATVSRLPAGERPTRAAAILACFCLLALLRGMYGEGAPHTWPKLRPVADKLNQVTPRGAVVLETEAMYFLSGREAPPGLEFQATEWLDLGPRRNALLHILPQEQLHRDIRAGRFATAAICNDDGLEERIEEANVYTEKFESGDCTVFWHLKPGLTSRPAP